MADTAYTPVPSSSTADDEAPKPAFTRDPESLEEVPLVPGISRTENQLRWGFIKKVYGIISTQLVLTALVVAAIYAVQPIQDFVLGSVAFQLTAAIVPLLGLIPLYIYRQRHPLNLVLLGGWTLLLSVGVGSACTAFPLSVVLEALALTAAIVVGLTAYAFHASARGRDFSFLGPILMSSLFALIAWSLIQIFLPVGEVGQTIFSLLGALVFSGFIVLDTANLISRRRCATSAAARRRRWWRLTWRRAACTSAACRTWSTTTSRLVWSSTFTARGAPAAWPPMATPSASSRATWRRSRSRCWTC